MAAAAGFQDGGATGGDPAMVGGAAMGIGVHGTGGLMGLMAGELIATDIIGNASLKWRGKDRASLTNELIHAGYVSRPAPMKASPGANLAPGLSCSCPHAAPSWLDRQKCRSTFRML